MLRERKKKDGGIPLNRDGLGVMIEAGEEKNRFYVAKVSKAKLL